MGWLSSRRPRKYDAGVKQAVSRRWRQLLHQREEQHGTCMCVQNTHNCRRPAAMMLKLAAPFAPALFVSAHLCLCVCLSSGGSLSSHHTQAVLRSR